MTAGSLATPGTLVNARGREWVVLPESTEEMLMVRPVGGLDEEVVGILPSIEAVSSATFSLPSKADLGDFTSGKLLREAARLSTRAAAGPFRSFGRIAVEPRPYQLVPLMMALKLDPVRLLIADDVGIGKTVEAAVIVRELLDRGEIQRFAVLCPPHLAEQWQRELKQKFHIDAELVLSSTIKRLERDLPVGVSVFDRHKFTVVSMDFIKSAGRADDFVHRCPEFVIVDEAHGCTLSGGVGRGRQLRHDVVRRISEDPNRHLVLVTATPHSGNEEAFRSLLGLLDFEFVDLPNDLEKKEREGIRRKLARHLVQRRRKDIEHYLQSDTSFPTRRDKTPEPTYTFGTEYQSLFEDMLEFARDYVAGEGGKRRQRVRYWSALALLRCVSSSPKAAIATLRRRAAVDQVDDENKVEDVGRLSVLDQDAVDEDVALDFSPGSDTEDTDNATRRQLLEFARRAEGLTPDLDSKLQGAVKEIKALIKDGFQPVVFCRFIDTADYVAQQLREALPAKIRVESVTGALPDSERETRIEKLTADGGDYVLVCTDCLSEGVNLQHSFNAVFHYDLAWNPTRHEQREGRVDRFGQPKPEVRVVTYYGTNPVDGVILDVLIRKHKTIKSDLGVTVAVPGSSEQVAEALFQGALFREKSRAGGRQMSLAFIDDLGPKKEALHTDWDDARERETLTRSRFAQHALSPEEVASELSNVRKAIGGSEDVEVFLQTALNTANVPLELKGGVLKVNVTKETPRALRQALGRDEPFTGRFQLPISKGQEYLGRTSPIVEGLASWVMDQALDSQARDPGKKPVASRCSVIATSQVAIRTMLLIVRFRFHLEIGGRSGETLLCEEIAPFACTGPADAPLWTDGERGEVLLFAKPEGNLVPTLIEQQLNSLATALPKLRVSLEEIARTRAKAQLETHKRVREAARSRGKVSIEPVLPVDILGAYVLLPKLQS
jgi:superfamily II DNA or RNA helicase